MEKDVFKCYSFVLQASHALWKQENLTFCTKRFTYSMSQISLFESFYI